MRTHADRAQQSRSREPANPSLQRKEGGQGEWQIENNRPEATTQGALQERVDGSPRVSRLAALAPVQLRALNGYEREKLSDARVRLKGLKERYEDHKKMMADALRKRGGYGNVLGYFQDLGWNHATEEVRRLDGTFTELAELSGRAALGEKPLGQFLSRVNSLDQSGGMNRFYNIFAGMEKELLSRERNDPAQFTEMDEVHFRRYLAASKSPMTVYRGDGRAVTNESFDTLPFTDVPAGGTPDITFAGWWNTPTPTP